MPGDISQSTFVNKNPNTDKQGKEAVFLFGCMKSIARTSLLQL